MKMETIIAAPHDGTVAEVYTAVGTQVAAGQVLLALVPDGPGRDVPGSPDLSGASGWVGQGGPDPSRLDPAPEPKFAP
jgi:pyruvate/2-oxoglutarate dehydrogenase complex dihydrolipoamide acyltransferase (E2) component